MRVLLIALCALVFGGAAHAERIPRAVIADAPRDLAHRVAASGRSGRARLRADRGLPRPADAGDADPLFAQTSNGFYAPIRIEMPTDVEQIGVAVLEARSFTAS